MVPIRFSVFASDIRAQSLLIGQPGREDGDKVGEPKKVGIYKYNLESTKKN